MSPAASSPPFTVDPLFPTHKAQFIHKREKWIRWEGSLVNLDSTSGGLEFNRRHQAAGTGDRDTGHPLGSIHLMVCVFLSPFWMDAAVVQVSNPVLNSRH
eukprot:gnl/TRDRNA2_/TRDRNA2_177610_c4_seq8.p5 gnl/TRDRNA2_/TRDRNA2_177610_c4~~gnl/TRDRNA2_/TRDRNA2_177610_c4_seq8.p5  ORF type:complete len:100 (+),score=0.43 gnl/TRDRNA2_/TRDRNA2_177610_c4_seq8:776-1075(+)